MAPVPLHGAERIGRCRAPEANPETGQRDVNVLRVLEDAYAHTDFGIYLNVKDTGTVALTDNVILPWS